MKIQPREQLSASLTVQRGVLGKGLGRILNYISNIYSNIGQHLVDPDSHHRHVAIGFFWVSLFVFVGKLVGAAKEMAIAWHYGVSETVDAYVFIFNLIGWPISVWFSILTVVLLPLVAQVRNQNPADLPRFRGELLCLTLAVGAVFGGLAYLGLPILLNTGWVGFSGHALQQALGMAGPLSLILPMGFVISLFSSWLMACGHHRNTLLEALPASAIVTALLMPHGWVSEPLVWGSVAGFALQLAGLGWPLQRVGELQRPMLGFQSPAWHGFWGSFGIMAAGQVLMSFTGIIDQFFAAHLGAGAISTLSYANRIVSLILSLGATAISRSTLPIFSELSGKGKATEIRALTLSWAKLMFLFGLVAMFVMWWLAPWMVKLLFQRGAFIAEDTLEVSEIMRYLTLQIPFYFCATILCSYFSSHKKYTILFMTGIIGVFVKPAINIILVPLYGIAGVAISSSVVYLSTSSYMMFKILKNKSEIK